MKLNPYLAVILAASIAGFGAFIIKSLSLSSTVLSFFRTSIPVIILLVYFAYKKIKLFQGNYKILVFASVLNAIRILLYFIAYKYASIGNAIIILFTWPIFATIFSAIFLKEKISKRTGLLIGLAFIGIIIMYLNKEFSFNNSDFIGMFAMLCSAIIYSITAVIFKKELSNKSEPEIIFYQNFAGAIIFLPFIFLNKSELVLPQVLGASGYAFLIGIIAFLLFFYALKRLKMSHYSLFTYWEVPAALIFSVIFFKEVITLNMILGGLLILISGILLRKKKQKN